MKRLVVSLVLVGLGACKREVPSEVVTAASAAPSASLESVAPLVIDSVDPLVERPLAPLRDRTELPSPFVEARRGTSRDFPYATLIEGFGDVVTAHFGTDHDLVIQEAQVEGARRALLLSPKTLGTVSPLVIVSDASGTVQWTKPRPFAGIRPGVEHFTITAGPHGAVAVAWYDEASHVVALRTWTAEGGILADFSLLDAEAADSIAALYWPGVGYLITIADQGAVRAQLLGDNGELRFGREGKDLAPRWNRVGPPSLAIDTEHTALVFFYATSAHGDEVRGVRIRDDGAPLWPDPVVVDGVHLPDGPAPHIDVQRVDARRVNVKLPGGRKLDVTSDGQVITAKR